MPLLVASTVKNNKSYQMVGALGGDGAGILWTGTVTDQIAADAGAAYAGTYTAFYGSMAGLTDYFATTDWSNAAIAAVGAPFLDLGLASWTGEVDTTTTDTISYSFSAPVPAWEDFTIVDPGASYNGETGPYTFTVSATYKGAAVSTAGWLFSLETPTGAAPGSSLSINAATGVITVESYAQSDWPDTIVVVTPNTPVSSFTVTAQTIPYDFWGVALPYIPTALLFLEDSVGPASEGTLASWQLNYATITGGGNIGDPGTNWAFEGVGSFWNDGGTDVLWRNENGSLALWAVSGTSIYKGGTIGYPGGTWSVVGIGDFNNDGLSDILFEDIYGDLATWEMNGLSIIGGGTLGNPGPSWTYKGVGDFNGNGYSDILFENANGTYAFWSIEGATNLGATFLPSPGAGWTFAGIGDFYGFGTSDVLFENPTTGQYMVWTMADDAIASSTTLGGPGVDYALASIGAYTFSDASDLMMKNVLTGAISEYDISNGAPSLRRLMPRRSRRPRRSFLKTRAAIFPTGIFMRASTTAARRSARSARAGPCSEREVSRDRASPIFYSPCRTATSRFGKPTALK